MADADDLDLDGIDIDEPEYPEPNIDGAEVDEFRPDSVVIKQTRDQIRARMISRYAGQLNAIELAKAIKDEITPLTGVGERKALAEAAMTKLTLDILAENVKPKSVREAAQAIEILHRLSGGTVEGAAMGPAERANVFDKVQAVILQLERTTGKDDKIPPLTREAIEVIASED